MSDETVRLSAVGRLVRRRWRLLIVLAVVGGLVGAGASLLLSPGYRTTSSVLLQGPRQADELLTEAQVATSSVVLDRAAAGLSWQTTGAELKDKVTSSVANGNVVTISAAADTPEHAQQLADKVAAEFVRYSTQLISGSTDAAAQIAQEQREALRQQVAVAVQRISELGQQTGSNLTVESVQVRTQLEGLRTSLEQAMNNLNQADAATSSANMAVLGPAERPTSAAAPTMTQLTAGGAALFLLLGVLGHLFAARADKRLRGESEIGAALSSTVLGTVDIPEQKPEARQGFVAALRRLVRADQPWDLPELSISADELNRDARYRRVLNRLNTTRPVLTLVPEGDAPAHRAVTQLAAAAGKRTPLRVAEVVPDRPTVPEDLHVAGVLVVLTVGSRTAWELVGIAEACADAGHEVLGVVLTQPVRPTSPEQPEVGSDHDVMAGSA
ncbi:exopolysaccharide biosynthesis protein [Amycolatopsis pithecellobii]|uniref:Exopolysaccharide biosynthesis protein n=1 Tax=Amycolatopsis pithecellobii TaxID=664692 RepID=A0A6N7ZA34_9PSEU|nr:exopolysaccharide biosynthesis protein [Amycolatopsis pithecellobii]MTD58592.1 exopolysaccharide biosynthesis protein [Amycolatopsis pithecellobii]